MSNIQETVVWESSIYQIGTTDAVLGGAPVKVDGQYTAGFANAPLQQLANRTQFLKQQVESALTSLQTIGSQVSTAQQQISDIGSRVTTLEGQLATIQSQISSLTTTTGSHTTQITAINTALNEIDDSITSINSRLTALESAPSGGSTTAIVPLIADVALMETLEPGNYRWVSETGSKTINFGNLPADGIYRFYTAGVGSTDPISFIRTETGGAIEFINYFFNGISVESSFFDGFSLYPPPATTCIEVESIQLDGGWSISVRYITPSANEFYEPLTTSADFQSEMISLIMPAKGGAKITGNITYVGPDILEPTIVEIGNFSRFGAIEKTIFPILIENNTGSYIQAAGILNQNSGSLQARVDFLGEGDKIYINTPIDVSVLIPV